MIPFKGKLFAIGAALLALVGFIASLLAKGETSSKYRKKIDTQQANLHKKAATEANKKAREHIKKSKEISTKLERESSKDEDEAIMRWNDDSL